MLIKNDEKNNLNEKQISNLPLNFWVGDDIKNCQNILSNVSQNVEYLYPKVGMEMEKQICDATRIFNVEKSNNISQIDESKLIFNQRIKPNYCKTFDELMNAFLKWWTETENHCEDTGLEHIKSLKRMKNHPLFGVNWFDLTNQYEQIINQLLHLERYEYKELRERKDNPQYGRNQINNFLKAIDAFGRANGIHGLRRTITHYLHLKPTPKPLIPNTPTPPVINKIIHYRYTSNEEINAEIKTILNLGFHIGPRPGELIRMKLSDVNDRNCEVKKREDKVDNPENWVPVDSAIMFSHQQPSVKKNWINGHRKHLMEKLSITKEKDEGLLFPDPRTGTRFKSSKTFYKWLCGYVKPVLKELYPQDNYDFYPKIMRTWCAIATLIRSYFEHGYWDIREVKYRLGHDDESDVTEYYVRCAKVLYQKHPYDWFRAVLKFHPTSKRMQSLMKEEYGESQEKDTRILTNYEKLPSEQNVTEGKVSAPVGIRTRVPSSKGWNDWPLHYGSKDFLC